MSDYYNKESMYAKYSLPGSDHKYNPFHSNNISATLGGPIIPGKQFFFFVAVEPLRSSASTGNQVLTFPDPQFAAWAQANYPNTFGTKILNTYTPSNATVSGVSRTAQDVFPGTCGTPATDNLPCSTAMIDSGVFNSSNFRNGMQYFGRIDKAFQKDRIYASFFRTTLDYGGPAVIPQFSTTNHNTQGAIQVNWTHTFSPTTFNELIYGQNRIEGFIGETGDFTIPGISVTGQSVGYGVGFAQGNFIQHNYHWRDVLTHVRGAHVLKVGYEGWFGDDVEPFQGPWSHPGFSFDNLLKLAQDAPANRGRGDVQPHHGPAAALGLGRRFQDLGGLRPGHLESQAQLDLDAGPPLRQPGQPVFPVGLDGLRQLPSRDRLHVRGAGGEWRRQAVGATRSIVRRRSGIRGSAWPGTSTARVTGWCAAARGCTPTG